MKKRTNLSNVGYSVCRPSEQETAPDGQQGTRVDGFFRVMVLNLWVLIFLGISYQISCISIFTSLFKTVAKLES